MPSPPSVVSLIYFITDKNKIKIQVFAGFTYSNFDLQREMQRYLICYSGFPQRRASHSQKVQLQL